ncbi:MAG: carboxylating nicotinate-nucleotide diphosphorylase [Candidatus Eremiobacteraeota bacterium]|nr:carboxylating nicotinate-nucleotide diphosphorylase [Candidatus Eremiobacteraeota bacterium]
MPDDLLIEQIVRAALLEDLGRGGDVTTDSILSEEVVARGAIVTRRPGVIAGQGAARATFAMLNPAVEYEVLAPDGADVDAGTPVASLSGSARAILTGERTALNFVSHLSGIATAAHSLVERVEPYKARIVCTRKTTPGLRTLERAAVAAGGASLHRYGLDDAVLIKDNHLLLCGSMTGAVTAVRRKIGHTLKVQVEVDTIEQLREALELSIDAVLLDNMPLEMLREAVTIVNGKILTEASGSVNADNVAAIAATGVDLISSGWITHSAPALDLSMEINLHT